MEQSTRGFAARTSIVALVVSLAVLATMRVGNAVPGGATREALSFAGTLRRNGQVPTEPVRLTFRFRRGATQLCEVATQPVQPAAGSGAFGAEIPLEACPAEMFDGDDITFDVGVGSEVIAADQRINPVPYAKYADRVGTPDCPVGYERVTESNLAMRVCRRNVTGVMDEIVRVGTGPSAFWIDRFEASVWVQAPGVGPVRQAENVGSIVGFPANGQWRTETTLEPFVFAYSVRGVEPARGATWFQAVEACRASGKRLPTSEEWLSAANGTRDRGGAGPDGTPFCRLGSPSAGARTTGLGVGCQSGWGAHDMIGGLSEWAIEWHAGVGRVGLSSQTPDVNGGPNRGDIAWPADAGPAGWPEGLYNRDYTATVVSAAASATIGGDTRFGIPAAAVRGGSFEEFDSAGIYAFDLRNSPSRADGTIGFRCVIPR